MKRSISRFNTVVTAKKGDTISDRKVGCCLESKGNGVNPGREDEGGPGPPSGEQDKQLTANRGGDNSPTEREEDGRKG